MPSLINAIGMRAHGPLALDRFGDGELEGWSAMQFIETSSITVHADEVCGRCFVDVFSCLLFDSAAAAAVAVAHFGGTFTLNSAPPMTYTAPVLGLLAGVAGHCGHNPVHPRHGSWHHPAPPRDLAHLAAVPAIVVCLSQRADGASWNLIMAAAQAVLTSAVFLLSIRRGEGGLSPADVLSWDISARTHAQGSSPWRRVRSRVTVDRVTGGGTSARTIRMPPGSSIRIPVSPQDSAAGARMTRTPAAASRMCPARASRTWTRMTERPAGRTAYPETPGNPAPEKNTTPGSSGGPSSR